jgi:hypothetical protein
MKRVFVGLVGAALIAGCADSNPPRTAPANSGGGVRVDAPGVKVNVQGKGDRKVDVEVKDRRD